MGLDMYLRARRYFSGWERINTSAEMNEWEHQVDFYDMQDFVASDSPHGYVEFCVAYWRKANQVHSWFVQTAQNGVDECQPVSVRREQLEKLRTDCLRVIADPELADTFLPRKSGVFFGALDYDEWYFSALRDTVGQIDNVLKLGDGWEFIYQSSW